MRGPDEQTSHMFSYVSPEERVRPDHPLRAIRRMTDEVLTTLSPRFTEDVPRTWAGRRFRRSSCCAPCCCSRSTPFAASGC